MQKTRRSPLCTAGKIISAAGLLIVLAVVLPKTGWWLIIGILLICSGIKLCRSQKKACHI